MRELTLQDNDFTSSIFIMRGQKVMLDADLAFIYGVETKRLNEAVKRNASRFPIDFMFQLSQEEFDFLKEEITGSKSLRSQIATLKKGKGQHRKYLPYAFTEHGTVMLASILNSPQAVEANIFVVRAFIKMREFLAAHHELSEKVDELEEKINTLEEQQSDKFKKIFQVLRRLIGEETKPRNTIGFKQKGQD